VYLTPPLKGFPLELGIGAGVKRLDWWDYQAEQKVWRYLQPGGYRAPTWETERRTDTGRQQRPRLRIASRGNDWRWAHKIWYTWWWPWGIHPGVLGWLRVKGQGRRAWKWVCAYCILPAVFAYHCLLYKLHRHARAVDKLVPVLNIRKLSTLYVHVHCQCMASG